MTFLVTGCAGFIGSHVCRLLLEDGKQLVGIDNLNDSYDIRLKKWRLDQITSSPRFSFQQLDISDYESLRTVFEEYERDGLLPLDGVVHLGARAGVRQSVQDPWVYYQSNTIGTLNLLELCRQFNVNKFVLASTSSVYGKNPDRPFDENSNTDSPLSPYAASKKAAENLTYSYHHLYGIDATVLRFFTVYGPAGRPDMSIFIFIRAIAEGLPIQIFGDGTQERDFTYVEDIARGTVAALKPVGYKVINLGSDRPVVLMDVIEMIESCLGKKACISYAPMHSADVMATWANVQRAKDVLGWQPQTSIEEGVERTVKWYRENRAWVKELI